MEIFQTNIFDGSPKWPDVTLIELGANDLKSEIPGELVAMMTEFNAFFGYLTDMPHREQLVRNFLEKPELGRCWIFLNRDEYIGYLILAFGFSFEYGGRDAFIDEFYLRSAYRNRGLGRSILEFICHQAHSLGVQTLHLEVERDNLAAQALYSSMGFQDQDRLLLNKKLGKV